MSTPAAAVQPPALPRVNGSWSMQPEQEWSEFVAGLDAFRFRESDRANWCGPFQSCGTCLAPFSFPGDLVWIDPTLDPRDGDFVIVAWGEQALQQPAFKRAKLHWRELYGVDRHDFGSHAARIRQCQQHDRGRRHHRVNQSVGRHVSRRHFVHGRGRRHQQYPS